MWICDLCDINDPTSARDDWKSGAYRYIPTHGYVQSFGSESVSQSPFDKNHDRCVVLVHGFANTPESAFRAYDMIAPTFVNAGWDMRGVKWPSEGRVGPFGYWNDYCDTRKSKPGLAKFLIELKKTYPKICIIAHSMGTVLVSETLCERSFPGDIIWRMAFHGSDASRRKFEKRAISEDYMAMKDKVLGLRSYWSANDLVLRYPARFMRPARRLGSYPMPDGAPANFESQSAEDVHRDRVAHSTYKKSALILAHTERYLNNGE